MRALLAVALLGWSRHGRGTGRPAAPIAAPIATAPSMVTNLKDRLAAVFAAMVKDRLAAVVAGLVKDRLAATTDKCCGYAINQSGAISYSGDYSQLQRGQAHRKHEPVAAGPSPPQT